MADVEAQGAKSAVKSPVKAAPKPPSPWIPRVFAAAAMAFLLAIPIVIPVVYMKVRYPISSYAAAAVFSM